MITHLKQNKVYTPKYHKLHEDIVKEMNLTPDLIKSNGMKKCPSYICKVKTENENKLIEHFQRLGIKPFWEEGMTFLF